MGDIKPELPRYGLRWNGPTDPVSVPMDDGYWTPWHLAQAQIQQARIKAEDERDEARALRTVDREKAQREMLLLKQRVADLKHALGTDATGWFDRFNQAQRERDEARAEVEMLRGVGCLEDGDGPCGACRKCAYRRGAEAMREIVAELFQGNKPGLAAMPAWAAFIRSLPIPEDKR